MNDSTLSRRRFLGQSTQAASAATLASMGMLGLTGAAHAAVSDYKAIVCLFLAGGNDGANMVVPLDTVRYSQYGQLRGAAGLALSGAGLMPARRSPLLAASAAASVAGDQPFAFNAALAPLDRWYGQGKVAVMLNIGNLRRPLTKAEYLAGGKAPGELFSHPDQQGQANAGLGAGSATGWGGRLMDTLGVARALDAVAVGTGGQFVQGVSTSANLVPESGGLSLNGFNFWPQTEADERLKALQKVLTADSGHRLANAANKSLADGIALANTLKTAATGSLAATFPSTSLGAQLKTTAQLIAAHAKLGAGRQVYYVSLGGFDTHGGQAWQHADLLSQLSAAVDAFQTTITAAGLDRSVTLFTASEFGRTLGPNATGTDHGWGSLSLVLGGAVKGGLYGEFPDFTLGGPDDASGRGVWIPRLGFQQLGATLGRWFGVSASALSTQVFPAELDLFPVKDLGFMG
ncbi:DUF1501 domain-containing protein [Sphaerotilus sp.]|uniref:DUF1501 domain-containing protein n=1 Tax=Sphaerotilus sp. TaxID=2093942 RepID=UPI00286E0357|nr:DUF1501 domain-containing protein [Sphaerotilus sp.]